MKEYKLFDFLKGMTSTKENIDFSDASIRSSYSPYMIDKFVSMVNIFLPVANGMNKCHSLPKHMHYEFYKNVLPKKYVKFNYIKKQKEDDTAIECISKYYDISEREAKMYITMFTKDQIKQIVDKYDFGKTR